jgi:hypothetical protein
MIGRAVTNLLKNAGESIDDRKAYQPDHEGEIRITAAQNRSFGGGRDLRQWSRAAGRSCTASRALCDQPPYQEPAWACRLLSKPSKNMAAPLHSPMQKPSTRTPGLGQSRHQTASVCR